MIAMLVLATAVLGATFLLGQVISVLYSEGDWDLQALRERRQLESSADHAEKAQDERDAELPLRERIRRAVENDGLTNLLPDAESDGKDR